MFNFIIIIETNALTKRIKEEGNMPEYGVVYYDQKSITNLSSISNMAKKGNHVYIKIRGPSCLSSRSGIERIKYFHVMSGSSMLDSMSNRFKESS